MSLHDIIFHIRKLTWLIQDGIGYLYLADIMQRRGPFHIVHIFIRKDIGMISLLLHGLHDNSGVCSRLSYMIACGFISVLDHIRKNNDKSRLKLFYSLRLLVQLGIILKVILRSLNQYVIQILYLISRMYVET